jgi:rhodanese-related sulfurtransferase
MLEKISLSKLQQYLSQDAELLLLDVRTFQEYQKSHVSGAISVPLHEIRRNASELPRDKKLL